jgi:hypothetical protein
VSGPCLSSSVPDRPLRPGIRRSLGGPLPRQQADRTRTNPAAAALRPPFNLAIPWGINPSFPGLSPSAGHVIHVLLTRAPLCHPSIATQMTPCDLHVLNTPPAFVLSQNQTLRKKSGGYDPSSLLTKLFIFQIDFDGISSTRTARPKKARSAQFNLFPLPSTFLCFRSIRTEAKESAGPHCQRSFLRGD